jgi:hypothetical protein
MIRILMLLVIVSSGVLVSCSNQLSQSDNDKIIKASQIEEDLFKEPSDSITEKLLVGEWALRAVNGNTVEEQDNPRIFNFGSDGVASKSFKKDLAKWRVIKRNEQKIILLKSETIEESIIKTIDSERLVIISGNEEISLAKISK